MKLTKLEIMAKSQNNELLSQIYEMEVEIDTKSLNCDMLHWNYDIKHNYDIQSWNFLCYDYVYLC